MAKKIIGIHGLANKPVQERLQAWWLQSINEGLKYIDSDVAVADNQFEMVYWADMMYVKEQSESYAEPFKLVETYVPASSKPKGHNDGALDWVRAKVGDKLDDMLDSMDFLDTIADALLSLKLKDLSTYWNQTRALHPGKTAQEVLQGKIIETLDKCKDDEIMLIAHSMGSIISFDVLAKERHKIKHYVTIGSPLGLPRVKRRLAKQSGEKWPVVPDSIEQWTNFSDHSDVVCGDPFLADDFRKNGKSNFIKDDIVRNQYEFKDADGTSKGNCHKSYGYLRCPELSKCIEKFMKA